MPDWSADDIARDIERRRERGRANRRRRSAEDAISEWNDADWATAFERKHGVKADPRWGRVRVREVAADGAVLFDGVVHVFHLTGQAYPWQGYAWASVQGGRPCFVSAIQSPEIKSERDAVRAWLGLK